MQGVLIVQCFICKLSEGVPGACFQAQRGREGLGSAGALQLLQGLSQRGVVVRVAAIVHALLGSWSAPHA